MGLLKKDLPEDDIKYIFTVEFERESEFHLGKSKLYFSNFITLTSSSPLIYWTYSC